MSSVASIEKRQELVSVITVNWNGRKWLPKLLISLENQSYPNIEIIVADNGSTDESVAYIETNHPNVNIIKIGKNLGFAGGNNAGIAKARGSRIMLINSDTWVDTDCLEKLMVEAESRNLDVIAPQGGNYETGQAGLTYNSKIDPLGHPIFFRVRPRENHNFYLSGACLLFSKQLYQETGGLDNNFFMYCEEVDWFWRLRLMGKKYDYSREISVYHAIGGSLDTNGLNEKVFLWRNQNTLQMLLKNYAWYSLLWVVPAYLLLNIFEMVAFILFGKPTIARTYFSGWIYNFASWRHIIEQRKIIQSHRIVADAQIIGAMYRGISKLQHLRKYLVANRTLHVN